MINPILAIANATGLSSLAVKAIAIVVGVCLLMGAVAAYNANLRQQGADKRETEIERQTNDATKKLGETVDAAVLDFDDCFDSGLHWNFAKSRCEGER